MDKSGTSKIPNSKGPSKDRSSNFSKEETTKLTLLLQDYPLITGKKTDHASNLQKEMAWRSLAEKFNEDTIIHRTVKQLQQKFNNIKKTARMEMSAERNARRLTGGGPPPPPPSDATEWLNSIMGESISGLPAIFDSDASDDTQTCLAVENETNKRKVPDMSEIHKEAEVEQGSIFDTSTPRAMLRKPVSKQLCLRNKELNELATPSVKRKGSTSRDAPSLKMDKCLIVSKVTRYEYEKHCYNNIGDSELERIVRKRGSDFNAMMATHNEQKAFEKRVAVTLRDMGKKVEMASRLTYNDELIKWCDVVVPCGGDGTFLLAASRVRDNTKPVIGFNSAPHKSVGRLCLPTWCSNDVKGAFIALDEGKFRWMRRSRIRTTITSEPKVLEKITPVDLHTLHYCRYPPIREDLVDTRLPALDNLREEETQKLSKKVLPFLALNEVFIGESVTSRVSVLRLQIDKGKWTHTKSSGLCVTTGTGSTSWHYSINCLRTHSVLELMKILSEELKVKVDTKLETAREIAEMYNQRLIFPPDSEHLAYSVREYITFEEWPTPKGLRVRNKAATVSVKSHCNDAGLVIDGSVSFPFNDGTEALLEIHPEDSLMTVHMDDALPH